ncbi:MAG: hypothetical protein K5894_10880, partial [Lachnospiraceae bacterium]|nr:hypothetical protein [Lachnospiraceae bacterium]
LFLLISFCFPVGALHPLSMHPSMHLVYLIICFDEKAVRKILLNKLDALKDALIKDAKRQPGSKMILKEIEDNIKGVYEQLSLFE